MYLQEDAEGRLSNTECRMAQVQGIVGMNSRCEEIDAAPEESSDDNHRLARKAVAKPTGDRRGDHVGKHEPECERTNLFIADVELALNLLLDPGQDVAIDVIDEVESREKNKCGRCAGDTRLGIH